MGGWQASPSEGERKLEGGLAGKGRPTPEHGIIIRNNTYPSSGGSLIEGGICILENAIFYAFKAKSDRGKNLLFSKFNFLCIQSQISKFKLVLSSFHCSGVFFFSNI